MKAFSLTVLLALVALAQPVSAQQGMPKPSPEMAKLDFFEGSWTCEGKMHESPLGPAGTMTTTAQIRDDLGGFWQVGEINGTMANMPPFEGRFAVTHDPGSKSFTMLWIDNMGGWARTTSPGWQGDRMVYTGESYMPGQKPIASRDTFTRSADGTMRHTWEAQINGKWTTLGEETCRKK